MDEKLRAGNKGTSEEELEGTLEKVLVLFRFIQVVLVLKKVFFSASSTDFSLLSYFWSFGKQNDVRHVYLFLFFYLFVYEG